MIGVDYGTLSGRAVVVRAADGEELGSAVHEYAHAVIEDTLPGSAVAATIVGQSMILGRPGLLLYAAAFGAIVFAFVRLYEEPTLARRFGAEHDAYRRAVPGWWPRR